MWPPLLWEVPPRTIQPLKLSLLSHKDGVGGEVLAIHHKLVNCFEKTQWWNICLTLSFCSCFWQIAAPAWQGNHLRLHESVSGNTAGQWFTIICQRGKSSDQQYSISPWESARPGTIQCSANRNKQQNKNIYLTHSMTCFIVCLPRDYTVYHCCNMKCGV